MMIVRNKDNCILNHTAPVPWPSPLTRVVSLDSLSPVLSLAVGCGSWQTPLSWSHHLSPYWTSLWARDSAQSSRARVTSSYSHCHIVRFTTHPARKSGNLNQSPIVAKALPLSTIATSGCCKFVTNPCLGQFVDERHDYALYHPICWISGISRAGERERVAHLPNTQVINPRGDNTRLYTFPKFDYLGQIQVPSQEIWIFSLRNVPACLMNCSQNYILHVCFHLNLKHANTRQLTRPLNSSHIEPIQITTRTPNCQCYCSQNGQKH